jgi:hypothetical protein
MLALAFLNPLLLWALPLAAVPIVIHLLNRRRFKRVPWAAMEFLLAAMKRNRKRLRMEQWLVLLLRTLAVVFLALLVARPQLAGGALLGSRTHHVVVFDDTASMSQRMGSTSLFDHAQDQIRALADKLGESRSGDLFSLVRSSHPTAPDLWSQRVSPELGKRTGALLKDLRPGDGSMNLGDVVKETRRRAAEVKEASRTRYYLVTDWRSFDWLSEDGKPRPGLLTEVLAMPADREHLEVDVVGGDSQNLAVAAVRRLDRIAVMNVPVALAVDVVNYGLDPSQPTEIAIEVDGKSRVVQPVEALAPGQRLPIPVTHTFHTAGFHRVEASLPAADHYPLDDRHTLAIEVKDKAKVLLVDGDPQNGGDEAETWFLTAALDPGGETASGIEPQVVGDQALGELDLKQFESVWLCNVPSPTEAVVKKLEAYVAGGGGLVVWAGGLVDPARYTELFYKDGKGLLPLPFGELVGDPDRPQHLALSSKTHPITARFPELLEMLMSRLVLVKRCVAMQEPEGASAAVLARLRDAEGAPVIAARPFGTGGEVVQFAITADQQWSNWPKLDINLIVLQQVHRHVARVQDMSGCNLDTRGLYRLSLDPGIYKADVGVHSFGADGEEHTFTAAAPANAPAEPGTAQGPQTLALDLAMADLHDLGAFEVRLRSHTDAEERRMFARNAPADESRLQKLDQAVLQRAWPPEAMERITVQTGGSGTGSGTGEGELWYWLAAALMAGLLAESLLAWRFGRR